MALESGMTHLTHALKIEIQVRFPKEENESQFIPNDFFQALLDSVGTSVESAVAEEIDGLPEMVDDFDHVFYDDPIIRLVATISLLCYDENSHKVQ